MDRRAVAARPGGAARAGRLRGLCIGLGLVALLSAFASPAYAGLKQEFAVFKNCPYENPTVVQCVYSTTTGGEFHLGSKTVPVAPATVVLQGGLPASGTELVPATNGETLSKTPLPLPGGLTGLGLGGPEEVTATAELVGPVNVSVPKEASGEGEAVSMPLRVKLDNATLGNECFIGSASEPVFLHLTTGTTSPPGPNTPITGNPGTLVIKAGGKIGEVSGSSLVDNSFAAPGAKGCEGGLADSIVNADSGLPAAAGTNTAILSGAFQAAAAPVAKHELALPEIGRCEKVPAEKVGTETITHGLYNNSGCTYEVPQRVGKFEWHPGTGAGKKFTGEAKASALETHAKTKITCVEMFSSGEYTSTKTATISGTFTGCMLIPTKEPCQTAGSAPGEIKVSPLNGELGFLKDVVVEGEPKIALGWLFKGSGSVLAAECGPSKIAVNVTGSAIGAIPDNKMLNSYVVKFAQLGGKQIPESFEEEPKSTLSMTFGAVPAEQVGLKTSIKITNEEKLEIKGQVE